MMPPKPSIRIGVLGMGFIGRHHVIAIRAAQRDGVPCALAAFCDPNWQPDGPPAGVNEMLTNVPRWDTAAQLFADPAVQVVVICTPTDLHVDHAIAALNSGKHVLVEKPVALRAADVQRLRDVSHHATTLCMPAMCMRFWPGWTWLHEQIMSDTFGQVQSAEFVRLGALPQWSPFYSDLARSGGALIDLHIHDVDFILWCFGRPVSVHSIGSAMHVKTTYTFSHRDVRISAEGGWDAAPNVPFQMRYRVQFARGLADFDINRTPRLMVRRNEGEEAVDVGEQTGYDVQIRELIKALQDGSPLRATLDDAVQVAKILEAEAQSIASHREIIC